MRMSRFFRFPSRVIYIFLALSCISLLILNIYELKYLKCDNSAIESHTTQATLLSEPKLKYVVYGKDIESGYLDHVFDNLKLLGYQQVLLSSSSTWDLMWAHEYPFSEFPILKNLQPHQKVNHFPGCGFITNKMDLSTSGFIFSPRAFKLPDDKETFLKYVSDHPKKKIVVKSNSHRGIKISNINDIDFNEKGIFIQEYIDNPLLVDGFKFDIGVYTIITSIEPLRVYTFDADALFRYCIEKYHPFDQSKVDKYVIGDDYLPTWLVPSLKKYFVHQGFSMKDSFNAHLADLGMDYKKIWENIEDAIRIVCLQKAPRMLNILKNYKSKNNFFELMRFDFVIDEDLNVHLMEVNMSPNLSSMHYKQNKLLYNQVLFNLFSLVGLGIQQRIGLNHSTLVADKNILLSMCRNCVDCTIPDCQICLACLTKETKQAIQSSYLEQLNKRNCKRIFPSGSLERKYSDQLSTVNKLAGKWYQEKCREEICWC